MLTAACITVLLAELVTRALAPRLGPPRLQKTSALDDKRRLAWILHRDREPVDTLFLGNSTVACAFDPTVIRSGSRRGVRSFNGALPGYDFTVHRAFYHRVYETMLAAPRVVLGVSMMDANRNERGFRSNTDTLENSPMWPLYDDRPPRLTPTTSDPRVPTLQYINLAACRTLNGASAVYRFGLNFQFRIDVMLRRVSDADRYGVLRAHDVAKPDAPLRADAMRHFNQYAVGGVSFDELKAFVRELVEQHKHPIVVNMPISPLLFERMPSLVPCYNDYLAAVSNATISLAVPLIDAQELGLRIVDFSDEYHLNDTGRDRVSLMIAKVLDAHYMEEAGPK